jgi:hypothetical protein
MAISDDRAAGPGAGKASLVNHRVHRALGQYLDLEHPPGFAVLLDGPWGAGKTHLIRRIIAEQAEHGRRVLLVSLHGLSSRAEIDKALALARWPRIVERQRLSVPRHGDPVHPRRIEPVDPPHVTGADAAAFVFDDLERCRMSPGAALGYINQFVERDGAKVVVLANRPAARKRARAEAFDAAAEKVIGRTFAVQPEFDAAFQAFLDHIKAREAKQYLRASAEAIKALHVQSGSGNLRILQHSLWDFERLYLALRPEHRSEAGAMAAMLRLFFALAFEFKAGCIEAEDLEDRTSAIYGGMFGEAAEPPPLRKASRRYPGVRLHDALLSDEVLRSILAEGLVDADLVQRDFDASSWFARESEPSWRTLWHSHERGEAELQAAAAQLIAEFGARAYDVSGEVLHVFGQMLKLSSLGIIRWDMDETVSQCRRYVEDLRAADRLEAPDRDLTNSIRLGGSHAGLGFPERNGAAFAELHIFFDEQRRLAEEDRHAAQAEELRALLETDAPAFMREMAYDQGRSAKYTRTPVFAKLDAEQFADTLVALPPLAFRDVMLAFSSRYDLGALRRDLSGEREWAEALERALHARAQGLGPFDSDRVRWIVNGTLGSVLKRDSAAPGNEAGEDGPNP